MMVSESRWHVGRVVHIYNSAYSFIHLDHHGRTTSPSTPFGSPPIQQKKKRITLVPRMARCFVASTHVILLSTSSHHHHSGDMYTHILIHRYYHNRSSTTLDFIAFW